MSTIRQLISAPLKTAMVAGALAAAIAPGVGSAKEGTFLVQLKDYEGHEAFYAMYLVDPHGRYERTLWVSGSKPEFYKEMPRWWKYLGRAPQKLDAITGASTPPGDRNVVRVHLDDKMIDSGYKIRVETAIENIGNFAKDVEVALDSKQMKKKIPGTGYVRYFRFKWD